LTSGRYRCANTCLWPIRAAGEPPQMEWVLNETQ
jgi:hypothetical protein